MFDGICGLCNSFINIIIKLDKKEIFRYASLQSNRGIELQKEYCRNVEYADSIILIDENCHVKALAIRSILKRINKLYALYLIASLLPASILDIIYDLVARNRYKVFGKYKTCRIPSERERRLFLE